MYKLVWNDDCTKKDGIEIFNELSELKQWLNDRLYEDHVYHWLVDDGEMITKWNQMRFYKLDENGEVIHVY